MQVAMTLKTVIWLAIWLATCILIAPFKYLELRRWHIRPFHPPTASYTVEFMFMWFVAGALLFCGFILFARVKSDLIGVLIAIMLVPFALLGAKLSERPGRWIASKLFRVA